VARERKAIADGLRDSVLNFEEGVIGVDPHEVMALLMMTRYFDALRDIGAQSNTILLPHSPSAVSDLNTQLRNAITAGMLAAMKSVEDPGIGKPSGGK
jgi:phosphoribosylpyrophosphate synthetase